MVGSQGGLKKIVDLKILHKMIKYVVKNLQVDIVKLSKELALVISLVYYLA